MTYLSAMNIYDTRQVRCVTCNRAIGEVEVDAEMTRPKCGVCSNNIPQGDEQVIDTANSLYHNTEA